MTLDVAIMMWLMVSKYKCITELKLFQYFFLKYIKGVVFCFYIYTQSEKKHEEGSKYDRHIEWIQELGQA